MVLSVSLVKLSSSFVMISKSDIGRVFVMSPPQSYDLGMGTMCALDRFIGSCPVLRMMCITVRSSGYMVVPHFRRSSLVIALGPGALFLPMLCSACCTWRIVSCSLRGSYQAGSM